MRGGGGGGRGLVQLIFAHDESESKVLGTYETLARARTHALIRAGTHVIMPFAENITYDRTYTRTLVLKIRRSSTYVWAICEIGIRT